MLVCGAGYGALLFFIMRAAQDMPWLDQTAPSLGALLVGVITGVAVRRRSLLLPLVGTIYACAALVIGVVGAGVAWGAYRGDLTTLSAYVDGIQVSAWALWTTLQQHWATWALAAAAAVPAFLLPLLRAIRLRRTRPVDEATAQEEEEVEPEYRGSFEPLQPPGSRPAGSLFTPRDPGQA
jgi:hypothetical protein